MHGNLLVLDDDEDFDHVLPEGSDGAMLGGGAYAAGCLVLRPGVEGETGVERAKRNNYPDIIVEMLASLKPRAPGGVDRARKSDIANLKDLAALVRPAYVIAHGKLLKPRRAESVDAWLDRVHELIQTTDDDAWIGVYDVHS